MAGFGLAGKSSRGWWTRLYAKSIYLEDSQGNRIVLVSCDLLSMPAGLADWVSEIISESSRIDREQIILAATHTHNGPGNFFSSASYNSLASPQSGFDEALFQFLAHRIALSITNALESKRPAIVKKATIKLPGLSRNRSLAAFEKNPQTEKEEIVSRVSNPKRFFTPDLPASVASARALQAVNPTLTTLKVEAIDSPEKTPIAVAAFYAVHPTAMGPKTEVYSSDIFGVASTLVEQHLKSSISNANPVVAIFNGPEGDISPNWKKQDRQNTLEIGKGLAKGILTALAETNETIQGDISFRYEVVDIADRKVAVLHGDASSLCPSEETMRTAKEPYPGVATLGGAEDGRTLFYDFGYREGLTSDDCHPQHGYKLFSLDKLIKDVLQKDEQVLIGSLISDIIKKDLTKTLPKKLALGVYSIGTVLLATLPGEFTVALGRRITRTLSEASGAPEKNILLVGLANEYLSYFTTPSEYNAQHYEGASTMYGQVAGLFVEQELSRIARLPKNTANYKLEKTYNAGVAVSSEFGRIKTKDQWQLTEALDNLMQDTKSGYVQRNFPQFIWSDQPIFLSKNKANASTKIINPVVSIELQKQTACKPLSLQSKSLDGKTKTFYDETDTTSLDFITVIDSVTSDSSHWHSIWLVPSWAKTKQKVRFCVSTPQGKTIHSEPFQIEAILSGKNSSVIPIRKR
jgi:neutral ceramidase